MNKDSPHSAPRAASTFAERVLQGAATGMSHHEQGPAGQEEGTRQTESGDTACTWRLIHDLWQRDWALLHAHLLKKHGVENEDDRNGILSVTNFRVVRAYDPERRDTRAGFRCYYLKSIDSEVADRWRKERRRVVRCDDHKLIALSARIEGCPSPEDQLIAREERAIRAQLLERLRVSLDSLSRRQEAALRLSLEEPQLKASQLALALGTTEGAVRLLLYRGRKSLRKRLLGDAVPNAFAHPGRQAPDVPFPYSRCPPRGPKEA